MNELMSAVVYPLVVFAVVTIVGAVAWFMKRFIDGQDQMNKTLSQISGAVIKLETWAEAREQLDDERHTQNTRNIEALWRAVRQEE